MRVDGGFLKDRTVSQDKLAQRVSRVASVAAMTALEDMVDGDMTFVDAVGLYVFDDDSTESTAAPLVYEPDAGDGAWLAVAVAGSDYLHEHANKTVLDTITALMLTVQNSPLTIVAMNDAAHTLTVGTAGAGQTQIVNNIVVADAESLGASEDLAFPAAADFVGMLYVANVGGEDIVLTSAGSQVLAAGEMAIFSSNGTGWAPFGRFVLSAAQYAALKVILAGTATVVDMAGVAHALVIGTAGAGETELTNRTVLCDANGAPAALTLPAVGDFEGELLITNIGGEDITIVAPAGTILPDTTAVFTSDGTTWRRVLTDALDAFFDDSVLSLGVGTVQAAIDALGVATQAMTYAVPFVAPALAQKVENALHAQYVAGGGAIMEITTAFTSVYPARNVELKTNATYDGGDITLDGVDLNDNVIQEVLTPAPGGGVVAGAKAFKALTAATSAGVVTVASEVDFGTGDYFAMAAPLHATDGLKVLATDGTVDTSAAVVDADTGCLSTTATPDGLKDFAGVLRVLTNG